MCNKYLYLLLCFFSLTSLRSQNNPDFEKYQFGNGFRFNDPNGQKYRITGYLQPFVETKQLLGSEDANETRFRMRRIRLRLEGEGKDPRFSYRFQGDLSGSGEELDGTSNYLLDAFVSYEFTRKWKLSFGQRATYTDNRELFMNSNSLQLVERSRLTSAFATIREFGLFLDGTYSLGNSQYVKPYVVISNGDGGNVFSRDRGGLKIGGRLDYLPLGLFNQFGQFNQVDIIRELTPKLVLGATYSYNQGMSSRRGRESGAILYLDQANRELLPDFAKFGIDFLFKYQGFSMIGEFVKTRAVVPDGITQRVRVDGSTSTSFSIDGNENMPHYVMSRMMLGEAYNLQMGYIFKKGISIDTRFTYIKPETYSFLNNGTFYNRPFYYTLGMSKYFGRNYGTKIQADITYIKNNGGINNSKGLPVMGNELHTRVIVSYSF
jgi:hypothetical protein